MDDQQRKEISAEWDSATESSRESMLVGTGELDLYARLDYLTRNFEELPVCIQTRILIKLGEWE